MNLALLNYVNVGNINKINDSSSKLSSQSTDNLNYYTWTNKFVTYLKSSQTIILPIFYNEFDFILFTPEQTYESMNWASSGHTLYCKLNIK